ncbi:hypothetical protein LGL55_20435 [Clostridium tagluense]|uniref:hypothetical protein n=1 Tax=Clostridium tagluense TaxID=360422 RepID=UPI001CF2B804|nr:hypothetical protein [Clostridium tagluense]MCB2313450.1 hypothetical protein [Clostridium tagluense]MCB2318283.1 hypothetical protein [Clostridium tagluense]MCB2328067.1 hypothetical protein [Clostridium tagluense]MCB2332777.1 hypothetical protein [Clostridium tagluense]MCB2366567.1 hypothetical protein [Clostridium tagluense]
MSKDLQVGTSVSLNSDLVLLVKDKNISKFQILGVVISMLGGLGLIISFKDNTI